MKTPVIEKKKQKESRLRTNFLGRSSVLLLLTFQFSDEFINNFNKMNGRHVIMSDVSVCIVNLTIK